MSQHSVFSLGRSKNADLQFDDPSISRLHAEFVIGSDGKYLLTDCDSSGGTHINKSGSWSALKQAIVAKDDVLRLGSFQISVQELLLRIETLNSAVPRGTGIDKTTRDDLPDGPVKRDRVTGEIIERKDA